ncbi:MAG: site-specific integrase [Ruminococcus sp.]|nr:site-specific integrase [Ruminococcus sp.]
MATIQKRKNSYLITVSLGYDSNGKQIRRTMTWKPERGMTKRQIKEELDRQKVLFEQQCRNGQAAIDNRIKLDDYISIYFENAKNTLSEYNYKHYQNIVKNYISPALGHLKLKDITPLHIQKFVNQLQEIQTNTKTGKLAPATVRRYYTVAQSIFHSAYKLGIIGINPADGDRITLPKLEEEKTEIFNTTELQQVMQALENEPLQFKVLIHLAVITGCRRGELVGLKWSDINFTTRVLTVQRSNYKVTGQPIQSKETKTGKRRYITIPPYCVKLLRKYRAEQSKHRLLLGDSWQGENWVFIQADGQPMYPSTPTLQFSKFLKRNGISHKKFHALRHTSATLLLSNGTNIKNVASRLGHTQLKTTDRYVHAVEEEDRKAAETFELQFSKEPKRA